MIAAACNGAQFGGGIHICPVADIEDGKMNVVVVENIKGLRLVRALLVLLKGKILDFYKTTTFLCDRIRFVAKKACAVQLDGELYNNLDFDVKLCKGLQFYRYRIGQVFDDCS